MIMTGCSRSVVRALVLVLFLASGCMEMGVAPDLQRITFRVTVFYDPAYAKKAADSTRIIIRDYESLREDTLWTGPDGIVVAPGYLPGAYDFGARRVLTADAAFLLNGVRRARTLNAAQINVQVLSRPDTMIILRLPQ